MVAASRSFDDAALMARKLDRLFARQRDVRIVSGHASGADRLGEWHAAERGLPLLALPAEWALYGREAGNRRNKKLATMATHVVVFRVGECGVPRLQAHDPAPEQRGLPLRMIDL